jgi:hypothetical protein
VIEQLAGDLLPNATVDQKVATGFIRNSTWNEEGGTDPAEVHWNAQVDRTNTVGTVLLGSTLECAQCHNHKHDPVLQKDFYAMQAFFNNPISTRRRRICRRRSVISPSCRSSSRPPN